MTTTGALGLLCGMFVLYPGIAFFIGYQVGRRRIKWRSPFYRGVVEAVQEEAPETDSPVRIAGKRSILGRMQQ